MDHHEVPVTGEMNVQFEPTRARLHSLPKSLERVLGSTGRTAPVRQVHRPFKTGDAVPLTPQPQREDQCQTRKYDQE